MTMTVTDQAPQARPQLPCLHLSQVTRLVRLTHEEPEGEGARLSQRFFARGDG